MWNKPADLVYSTVVACHAGSVGLAVDPFIVPRQTRRCPIAILQIIDQLADKLNNSPKMPLSSSRIVDANEVGQLLERLRISVPSSIMESERTLQERERILSEAEAEAKRIIHQARQKANEMLQADPLVNMARREAERIVEEGRADARQRADAADEYAAQVLEDLAERLVVFGKQVDNGLQVMRGRRTDQAAAQAAGQGSAAQGHGSPQGHGVPQAAAQARSERRAGTPLMPGFPPQRSEPKG